MNPSIRTLRQRRMAFGAMRSVQDLAELLEVPRYRLQLLSAEPRYHHFGIPKADGSQRWIEDPEPFLKSVQRSLNDHLQAVYYFRGSSAAFGFTVNPKGTQDPRNIVTHARQHLGCRWLYNADIEDFFHRIRFEQVFQLFSGSVFGFDKALAELLTRLCTNQERLPMGAPTSPVLSNLACLAMDQALLDYAQWAGWCYTRFADDMSFSTAGDMDTHQLPGIEAIVGEYGFTFNPAKIKLMGPDDPKHVTGLRLADEVELPKDFFPTLGREIARLGHVVAAQHQMGGRSEWVNRYEERIEGMITFAAFVLGDDDPRLVEAEQALAQQLDPPPAYAASWLDFAAYT